MSKGLGSFVLVIPKVNLPLIRRRMTNVLKSQRVGYKISLRTQRIYFFQFRFFGFAVSFTVHSIRLLLIFSCLACHDGLWGRREGDVLVFQANFLWIV